MAEKGNPTNHSTYINRKKCTTRMSNNLARCYFKCGLHIRAPAIPTSLSEMKISGITSDLLILNMNLQFNKIPRWFVPTLKFEHYWTSRLIVPAWIWQQLSFKYSLTMAKMVLLDTSCVTSFTIRIWQILFSLFYRVTEVK